MDRKEFLKTCTGGLCACAAACIPVAANAAEAPKPDDWKLPFARQRYAKLLGILSDKMGPEDMSATLHELGEYCAATSMGDKLTKFRGDPDGYMTFIRDASQGTVTVERSGGAYVQTYKPGADCTCPLVSKASNTPAVVCDCSVGWARQVWRQVLAQEPKVALRESVLRGDKACVFEITPV